ncbi:MAG: hypothetical protein IT249_00785 [Chitinophagaceae bacterium]|nr:hypothetical protein [Chitinophagaceae bacterium]
MIFFVVIPVFLLLCGVEASAQCSICTKTAQQMGEGPAKALNVGIIYLMLIPFAVVGFIVYHWWKNHRVD